MKKAIITVGIPCSGKTTWAEEFVASRAEIGEKWKVVSRDNTRVLMHLSKRKTPFAWKTWNWKWEKEVTAEQELLYNAYFLKCDGIVVADMNLNKSRRQQLLQLLQDIGYETSEQHFEVSFEEACRRDAARLNGVGYAVIAEKYEQWFNEFRHVEKYVRDVNKQPAIIVDVDGTVAHMNGRGPFDWDRVGEDLPKTSTIALVKGMYLQGHHVIFLSGRSAKCFTETQKWLENNVGVFFSLYMRNEGDIRDDRIVKRELFDAYIRDNYNVVAVLDDRPKVGRQWVELGLDMFWVGNPFKEF